MNPIFFCQLSPCDDQLFASFGTVILIGGVLVAVYVTLRGLIEVFDVLKNRRK